MHYFLVRREVLNLRNPKTYSEKIQWLKLNGNLERFTSYTDKYEVREYVRRTIGDQYLIPLLGVWDSFDDIPFDDLPEQFVIKATHGAGYNYICRNKKDLNKKELKEKVNKWLSENFYTASREPQYKLCRPRIICEKYMEDSSGELRDYKFWCFSGEPDSVMVIEDRQKGMTLDIFDMTWKRFPIKLNHYENAIRPVSRPKRLDDMVSLSRKLSREFPAVRVDLYLVEDKIYFGELTFTPGSGLNIYHPASADRELGDKINLEDWTQDYAA
jgi:hypothetical protein